MKCSSCKSDIDEKFKFAIKKNICPVCGESIMDADKLVAFTNLKNMLEANWDGLPVEQIATMVIANFELKQIFKKGETKETVMDVEEPTPKPKSDKDFDEEHKRYQMEEARKKIREEEYANALRNQYGMGDTAGDGEESDSDFWDEQDANPIAMAHKAKTEYKQKEAYEKMVSGQGKVARSG